MDKQSTYVAFADTLCIRTGTLTEVLSAVKLSGVQHGILIFDNTSGQQIDFDLRGTLDEVLERVTPKAAPIKPGRPKLGVESREITLLPRHWQWLEEQPSGISATVRKLVEEKMRTSSPEDLARRRRDAAYKIMSSLAGNCVNFEEASRALFAGDAKTFAELIEQWPQDIRQHLEQMLSAPHP